jgi:hypothetical protein
VSTPRNGSIPGVVLDGAGVVTGDPVAELVEGEHDVGLSTLVVDALGVAFCAGDW